MSKQFEFRIEGDERSFIRLLESNNISYYHLPKRTHIQRHVIVPRDYSIKPKPLKVPKKLAIDDIAIKLVLALTPLTLEKIWNWYKRKQRSSKVSVTVEGNLLELNPKTVKVLTSLLKEIPKEKMKTKRGEQK